MMRFKKEKEKKKESKNSLFIGTMGVIDVHKIKN